VKFLYEQERKMDKSQKRRNKKKKPEVELYGMNAEDSLQSVNFATTENPYLNEYFQTEPKD
jgi:hypothetical protein